MSETFCFFRIGNSFKNKLIFGFHRFIYVYHVFFPQYYLRTTFNILTLLIQNSNTAKPWFHAVQYPTAPTLSMLYVNTHFNILNFFSYFSLFILCFVFILCQHVFSMWLYWCMYETVSTDDKLMFKSKMKTTLTNCACVRACVYVCVYGGADFCIKPKCKHVY